MKTIKFILLFICLQSVYGQTFKGIILDSLTNKPIAYSTLSFENINKGTYCNELGEFTVKWVTEQKTIIISCLGFEKKTISYSDLKINTNNYIKLVKKENVIDEIVIVNVKKKYTGTKKIITPQVSVIKTGLPFGYEFSTLIKNKFNKPGKIQSITLSLRKRKNLDYLATYKVKFYEYDSINKRPGESIYDKNLIIEPENKTYHLKIKLDTLNIDFPKNGICVGIEIINKKHEEKINSMSKIGPYISFTHTKSEILTWDRYFDKKWFVYTRKSDVRNDFKNGMINAEVKIEN
jgi:hypothetical protein